LRRERTLLISEVSELLKASEFLNSKSKRSEQTKKAYHIALSHLQTFLKNSEYKDYDVESILIPLLDKKINVYSLFDKFGDYLANRQDQYFGGKKLRPESIILYVAGVRSYFEFHDVEISSRKFQNKVTLPRKHRSEPEPIDAEDVASMLKACNNKRLRAFIFLLATTGMRANEALSLKNSDINFERSPTTIHVRADITKTKQERYIYTTDEATKYLKIFIDSKYRNYKSKPDHILFKMQNNDSEEHKGMLYSRLSTHFSRLLEEIGMNQRKDGDGKQRRKISFHSFRRFVKSTISDIDSDYSEWFLGHSGSVYWVKKEQEKRDKYLKCMKYLTFLDYPTIDAVGKDFESKLEERDQEIDELQNKIFHYEMEEQENKKEVENMRDYVNKRIKDFEAKTEKLRNAIPLMLHNYFVAGKRNDKSLLDLNNEQNADLIRKYLKEIDIDEFHLAPDIVKHYKLDRKQKKKKVNK
jgi:integrase